MYLTDLSWRRNVKLWFIIVSKLFSPRYFIDFMYWFGIEERTQLFFGSFIDRSQLLALLLQSSGCVFLHRTFVPENWKLQEPSTMFRRIQYLINFYRSSSKKCPDLFGVLLILPQHQNRNDSQRRPHENHWRETLEPNSLACVLCRFVVNR